MSINCFISKAGTHLVWTSRTLIQLNKHRSAQNKMKKNPCNIIPQNSITNIAVVLFFRYKRCCIGSSAFAVVGPPTLGALPSEQQNLTTFWRWIPLSEQFIKIITVKISFKNSQASVNAFLAHYRHKVDSLFNILIYSVSNTATPGIQLAPS